MDEYLLFYKRRLPTVGRWGRGWDIAISAFNSSPRVQIIARRLSARTKHVLMLPEYSYATEEEPHSVGVFRSAGGNEADYMRRFRAELGTDLAQKRIVIDITGFISHYVLALIANLQLAGVRRCDVVYGEPVRYLKSERTQFSDEAVMDVRQVIGYEGVHTNDTNNDILILGVGYDSRLVAEVANTKEHARKVQLFGLPSLRPDMYQESLLRASQVAEALGPDATAPHHFQHAPANDPFVTASVVSSVVREHRRKHPQSNVYLSPLATKAQALGFALFYLRECRNTATSVVFPFCKTYMRETSEGLSGVWLYELEL